MKVSIITICFNNITGLEKTAGSILAQSCDDYEWIVIDGGSSDGTDDFLQKHDEKIAYWCSEPDKGIYNAMNKGIEKAKGDYLLFLNSGDVLYDDRTLEKALPMFDGEDILYGDAWFQYSKHPHRMTYDDKLTLKRLYEYSINHQSTFIKTVLLKERGYDETYKIVADWKRFVEWLKEGRTFKHLKQIIAVYDTTGVSTLEEEAVHKERDRFFRELYPEEVIDLLEDWLTFQNKPCIQTRYYVKKNKLFRRLIRSNLHFIRWISHFM